MEVRFNPRENGACPVCRKERTCTLRARLAKSMADLKDPQDVGLELVVYSCPMFEEKF